LSEISFTLENRTQSAHMATCTVEGLGPGQYAIEGISTRTGPTLPQDAKAKVSLSVGNEENYHIRVRRV
jgi:hypothetical protein